jgi:hypothetical protein
MRTILRGVHVLAHVGAYSTYATPHRVNQFTCAARPCVALPLLFCLLGLVLSATIILVAAPEALIWALALIE